MKEALKHLGPENVADALEINRGGYDYGWNNVLKAASILGEASGTDRAEAVKQLISNLEVDEPNLVTISTISLGKIKDVTALPHLEKLVKSQPSISELEREKSLNFSKTQREEYARRSGATLTNYPKIPNANEQHQKIREAAVWAINEIKNEQTVISEKKNNQSLNISQAFDVFNNPQNFSPRYFFELLQLYQRRPGKIFLKQLSY